MKSRAKTDKVIVHCSFSKAHMDWGVEEIYQIHVVENKWAAPGYHYIIKRDGTVDLGRPHDAEGAHCHGQNATSIGVCLIGGMGSDGEAVFNYTSAQMKSLDKLVSELRQRHPGVTIHGHNEFSKKTCPNFEVSDYFA